MAVHKDKPLFELNAYGYRERAQHCRDFAMTLPHGIHSVPRCSRPRTASRCWRWRTNSSVGRKTPYASAATRLTLGRMRISTHDRPDEPSAADPRPNAGELDRGDDGDWATN